MLKIFAKYGTCEKAVINCSTDTVSDAIRHLNSMYGYTWTLYKDRIDEMQTAENQRAIGVQPDIVFYTDNIRVIKSDPAHIYNKENTSAIAKPLPLPKQTKLSKLIKWFRIVLFAIMVVACIIVATYRVVMLTANISQDYKYYYVTVFGQTDKYYK